VSPPFRIELLDKHDRSDFVSGSEALDRYLRERAGQDMRRRVASCFVATDRDGAVAGFYTIAASSIVLDRLDEAAVKRLPRYPAIPAVLLGRLAVAQVHQGKRLGGALVADALVRATRSEVMAYAMIVDAKDAAAIRFYQNLGFTTLNDDRKRLIRALQD